ncbi:MAG TPA: hypothetical protein VN578_12860 [Candidatus Binatia bacterium]|jgi:hypothetical protein|nr:hypothetical protein [Candidatus Binatia bacterium]
MIGRSHSELHQWLSVATKIRVAFTYSVQTFDAQGQTDYQWLLSRTAVPFFYSAAMTAKSQDPRTG